MNFYDCLGAIRTLAKFALKIPDADKTSFYSANGSI